MEIQVDRTGTVEGFSNLVKMIIDSGSVGGILALSCDANGFTPGLTDPILKKIPVPIFGGIFPAIISGREKMEKGSILAGIPRDISYEILPCLSDQRVDYDELLDERMPHNPDIQTMLVFVDGFSKRIDAFINSLFNIFGLEINYIGGGAGSLSMEQKPCLFSNQGLLQDSAILATLPINSGVGVSHGWKSIQGPFMVTESDRNIIRTLDWKPAFEVYKTVVESHSGQLFESENFFDIAKAYPFGIAKMGAERIVRDPLMLTEDYSLVCVGEVPVGSFIDILNGDENSLIEAARKALLRSEKNFPYPTDQKTTFFIDCISRVLFLGSRFQEEILSVHNPNHPMIGACTIGEIANNGKDYLEFYNKTAVVSILEA